MWPGANTPGGDGDIAEKQTDVLASLDRFVLRRHELGLAADDMADLRRVESASRTPLGLILDEIARRAVLGLLVDG
jgi:hypothetical protein